MKSKFRVKKEVRLVFRHVVDFKGYMDLKKGIMWKILSLTPTSDHSNQAKGVEELHIIGLQMNLTLLPTVT